VSIERRRAPRINLLKPVPGRVGPEEQPIEVRQMSVGGMLIDTATQLSPLGLHEFSLALDDRTVTLVRGEIVHSRYTVDGSTVTYTFGVAFAQLPDDADEQVRRFVAALQQSGAKQA